MNEKIRELRQQATIIVGAESGFAFDREVLDEQKFTELIVKECIQVCADRGTHHDGLYSAWAVDCSERIGKHFGVEESVKVETKHKCSVCGTTENVSWVGGHQPYLCNSLDCIPF